MQSAPYLEKIGSSGPFLIMLHGWGQSLQALKPLAELLSASYQVILFDLPGFGKSAPPSDAWDSFQYAEYLMKTIQGLGIQRFSVLGHSFGGKVAMSLVVSFPTHVDSLILIAASGLKRKRTFINALRFYAIRALGKVVKRSDKLLGTNWFSTYFVERFGSKDYKQASQMRGVLVKSVNEDFTPHLAKIHVPTLLLWGELDQETPPDIAERLNRHIKRSTLHMFPNKDHYLFQECGAHLAAYYIRPFLKENHG